MDELPTAAAELIVSTELPLTCANDRAVTACASARTAPRPKVALPIYVEPEKEVLRGIEDFLIPLHSPEEDVKKLPTNLPSMSKPLSPECAFPKLELTVPEEDNSDWEEKDGRSPLAEWKPWHDPSRPPNFNANELISQLSEGASDANRMKLERCIRQTEEDILRQHAREQDDVCAAQKEQKFKRQRRMKMED